MIDIQDIKDLYWKVSKLEGFQYNLQRNSEKRNRENSLVKQIEIDEIIINKCKDIDKVLTELWDNMSTIRERIEKDRERTIGYLMV